MNLEEWIDDIVRYHRTNVFANPPLWIEVELGHSSQVVFVGDDGPVDPMSNEQLVDLLAKILRRSLQAILCEDSIKRATCKDAIAVNLAAAILRGDRQAAVLAADRVREITDW